MAKQLYYSELHLKKTLKSIYLSYISAGIMKFRM